MLNIIAWILFLTSLLVIIIITIRKFSALSILNIDNIPGKKEAKFKERIMRQRLERDFSSIFLKIEKRRRYLVRGISLFLKNYYSRLLKAKTNLKRYKKTSFTEKKEEIDILFIKTKNAQEHEKYEEAENYLIEIISLDSKKIKAFLNLSEIYRLGRKFKEARETLEHSLKLYQQLKKDPEMLEGVSITEIYFSLACICQEASMIDEALEYGFQALDIEPNNPRYLDLILDLSIIKKDKKLSLEIWDKLSLANPDNQKLSELKEKIGLLKD